MFSERQGEAERMKGFGKSDSVNPYLSFHFYGLWALSRNGHIVGPYDLRQLDGGGGRWTGV